MNKTTIRAIPKKLEETAIGYIQTGKWAEAAGIFKALVKAQPLEANHHYNLACCLTELGEKPESITHYLATLAIDPEHKQALNNLGNLLTGMGHHKDALKRFQQLLAINPDHLNALGMAGTLLGELGKKEEGLIQLKKALEQNPNHWGFRVKYADLLHKSHHLTDAIEHYNIAQKQKPDNRLLNNIASIQVKQGLTREAMNNFKKSQADLTGDGKALIQSNIIMCQHYLDGDPVKAKAAIEKWAALFPSRQKKERSFSNTPDKNRRLKVGYVSADFRVHPVGFFMIPVFHNRDRKNFDLYCYSNTRQIDGVTAFLKKHSDHWRETMTWSDGKLTETIINDGIDILIDLAGHTAHNRLGVFADRAAPVQISAGGHFCSTGLPQIDYLVCDDKHVPEQLEHYITEKPLRLPDSYTCYGPPSTQQVPGHCPFEDRGYITFGSFNNLAKISDHCIRLWSKVLNAVPKSRLLLRTQALTDKGTSDRLLARFKAEGFPVDRLIMEGGAPHQDFIQSYRDVDIALDTTPYSGGLTTLEALWMGVPVMTLTGETFASRHSTAHLKNCGLDQLIAATEKDFVSIATTLCADQEALKTLKTGLRDRLSNSPLCDGKGYTKNLEQALRHVWQDWCDKKQSA